MYLGRLCFFNLHKTIHVKLYFTIKELCIAPTEPIPVAVADKLLTHHILPMNVVRRELGKPIHCVDSMGNHSGYRPEWWELQQGRSGGSQHTFKGLGAIDWRADKPHDIETLWKLLQKHTQYTRLVFYRDSHGNPLFIHCDYKATDGRCYLFSSDASSNWEFLASTPL